METKKETRSVRLVRKGRGGGRDWKTEKERTKRKSTFLSGCVHSRQCSKDHSSKPCDFKKFAAAAATAVAAALRRCVVKLISGLPSKFRRGEWRAWSVRAVVPGSHALCRSCFQSGWASERNGFVLVSHELLPWRGREDARTWRGVHCLSSGCTYEAGAEVTSFIVKCWMAEEPTCNIILGFYHGACHSRKW